VTIGDYRLPPGVGPFCGEELDPTAQRSTFNFQRVPPYPTSDPSHRPRGRKHWGLFRSGPSQSRPSPSHGEGEWRIPNVEWRNNDEVPNPKGCQACAQDGYFAL